MKTIEGKFEGLDGLKLYYQGWMPENEPKAIIQVVHAFAEHSGRYKNIINELIPLNYAVYAHDLRGHGKSDGIRNFVENMGHYVDDQKIFYDLLKNKHPNLPFIMLGHSFGAVIILNFLKTHEKLIKGAILSALGMKLAVKSSGLMKLLAKIFSKIFPRMKTSSGLKPELLSHDLEVVKAYMEDPFVNYKKITARLGYIMIKSFEEIPEILQDLKIPILIQCGSEDRLVSGALELKEMIKNENIKIIVYEGLYHEVYNETENYRTQVFKDLFEWLKEHV
ncbi:MAG: lysophospholipase [Promethearchaeota archaeon]